MRKVAIIHFSPLELYPPVQNLLRSLDSQSGTEYYVYTTEKTVSQLSTFTLSNPNIKIKRFGTSGNNLSPLSRWMGYCSFHIGSFLDMMVNRPVKVLYYETLSFLPVYLFRKFVSRKIGIWAHYHEYTSPAEYNSGMKLSRKFHDLEREVYADMDGVSHTNEHRLEMFMDDITPSQPRLKLAIPNFPPRIWDTVSKVRDTNAIKIVYIGALSLETMYTKEFAAWVQAQQGRVEWDIYSFNITDSARTFIESNTNFIKIFDGLDYDKLPEILSQYDIGVILYTGHIPNYIHNAPNKLFEYLRMGLQVWLPHSLEGAKPYLESTEHPRVLSLNFKELTLTAKDIVIERSLLKNKFIAEEANAPLIEYLGGK